MPKRPAPLRPAVVTLGPVAAPVVRTGAQVFSGSFIAEGLNLFVVTLDEAQGRWLAGALSVVIAAAMNWLERRRGRKLIGVSA